MSIFETEAESFESSELGEFGNEMESLEMPGEYENQEQFLPIGNILGSILGGEMESPLNEMQELELANELLEINNEQELEQFLGKLIKGAAKSVGGFVRSPVGRALGNVFKDVARKALPVVGGALGSFVAPGVGTAIGSKLGSMASKMFELELEGVNEQEAEFEVARRYVRFATTAAQQAARAPRNAPPRAVVRGAVLTAAQRHAPGLAQGSRPRRGPGGRPAPGRGRPRSTFYSSYNVGTDWGGDGGWDAQPGWNAQASSDGYGPWSDGAGGGYGRPRSGRWYRRGSKIILLGL